MARAPKKASVTAVPPAPTSSSDEANRRGELVRAAGRLFREKGYAATTIRDIAGAVNMRSGSPFYHFKTKHDILCAVVLEGIGAIHAAVAAVATRDLPPRQRFEAMAAIHLEVLLGAEGCDFAATLLHESRHLEPEQLAEVIRLKDAYEALWQRVLNDLRKAGQLDDNSPVARLFLMGAMNWTTLWFRPDGRATPKSLARQLASLLLR